MITDWKTSQPCSKPPTEEVQSLSKPRRLLEETKTHPTGHPESRENSRSPAILRKKNRVGDFHVWISNLLRSYHDPTPWGGAIKSDEATKAIEESRNKACVPGPGTLHEGAMTPPRRKDRLLGRRRWEN